MINKYNELLIEGLTKLKELEFSSIPDAKEIEYTFSDEYIKTKNKLLNKLDLSYWKYVNTITKKIAAIIIALIVSFTSLMTVEAFRGKIINFLYEIYDTFTELSSNKEQAINIEKYYCIKAIPKNFMLSSTNQYSRIMSTYWVNNNQNYIMLTQTDSSNVHQFNTEYGTLNEVIINNTPCLICKTSSDYFCYWEFDGYRFELVYPIDLGEEFMSEVVGNLVEIDPAELEN